LENASRSDDDDESTKGYVEEHATPNEGLAEGTQVAVSAQQ